MTALKLALQEPDIHEQARQAGDELNLLCSELEKLETGASEAEAAFASSPDGKTLEAKAVKAQLRDNAKRKLEERRPEFEKLFGAAHRASLVDELARVRKCITVQAAGIPYALARQHEKIETLIEDFRKNLKGAITDLREGVAQVNVDRQKAQDLADQLRTGESFPAFTAEPVLRAVVDKLRVWSPSFPLGDWNEDETLRLTVADGAYSYNNTIIDFRMKFGMDRGFR